MLQSGAECLQVDQAEGVIPDSSRIWSQPQLNLVNSKMSDRVVVSNSVCMVKLRRDTRIFRHSLGPPREMIN